MTTDDPTDALYTALTASLRARHAPAVDILLDYMKEELQTTTGYRPDGQERGIPDRLRRSYPNECRHAFLRAIVRLIKQHPALGQTYVDAAREAFAQLYGPKAAPPSDGAGSCAPRDPRRQCVSSPVAPSRHAAGQTVDRRGLV